MAKPKTATADIAAATAGITGNVPLPENAAAIATARAVFAIEDNVPLPTKRVGVKGESTYPFAKLNIGQSFFVPVSDKIKEPWKTLTSMASRMTREHWPKKFITARIPASETTPEGVRVWRTTDGTGELAAPKLRPKKAEAAVPQPQTAEAAKLVGADPFVGQQQAAE